MQNKFKAFIITIAILFLCAAGVYGFTRNVQFLGIILASTLILFLSLVIYNFILEHLNNKN